MSGGVSLSDPEIAGAAARALAPIRVDGGIGAIFHQADGATRLVDLSERGGYRLKFPTTHAPHLEAVQINTGGGVVGGDRLSIVFQVQAGADAVFATQAAERIYRSNGPACSIGVQLKLAPDARLDWLPQETILYSGARLQRRFDVDLAASSRLLIVEAVTFGRIASGEVLGDGALHDVWRVRRDGRLLFADATRLTGNITTRLARPAIAGGAAAFALVLYVGPDASDRRDAVRAALEGARSDCGVSAWNGMLTARFLGAEPGAVRHDVLKLLELLGGRPMPRVWQR